MLEILETHPAVIGLRFDGTVGEHSRRAPPDQAFLDDKELAVFSLIDRLGGFADFRRLDRFSGGRRRRRWLDGRRRFRLTWAQSLFEPLLSLVEGRGRLLALDYSPFRLGLLFLEECVELARGCGRRLGRRAGNRERWRRDGAGREVRYDGGRCLPRHLATFLAGEPVTQSARRGAVPVHGANDAAEPDQTEAAREKYCGDFGGQAQDLHLAR